MDYLKYFVQSVQKSIFENQEHQFHINNRFGPTDFSNISQSICKILRSKGELIDCIYRLLAIENQHPEDIAWDFAKQRLESVQKYEKQEIRLVKTEVLSSTIMELLERKNKVLNRAKMGEEEISISQKEWIAKELLNEQKKEVEITQKIKKIDMTIFKQKSAVEEVQKKVQTKTNEEEDQKKQKRKQKRKKIKTKQSKKQQIDKDTQQYELIKTKIEILDPLRPRNTVKLSSNFLNNLNKSSKLKIVEIVNNLQENDNQNDMLQSEWFNTNFSTDNQTIEELLNKQLS